MDLLFFDRSELIPILISECLYLSFLKKKFVPVDSETV